jgi:hypothetical protein
MPDIESGNPLGFGDQLPPSYEEFILKPTAHIEVKPAKSSDESESADLVEVPLPIPFQRNESVLAVPPEYSTLKRSDMNNVQTFSYNMA